MRKLDMKGNHMNTTTFINTAGISLAVKNLFHPTPFPSYLIENTAYQC
jgi:hypothetical protein